MLLRFRIQGFKSFFDTTVFLGPYNCIAGLNASGKSNFFDALKFLRHLTSGKTLQEAAICLREEEAPNPTSFDLLFFRSGSFQSKFIRFEADLLIEGSAVDDLGVEVVSNNPVVRYTLQVEKRPGTPGPGFFPLMVTEEDLRRVTKENVISDLVQFIEKPRKNTWFASAYERYKSGGSGKFITVNENDDTVVDLHQDGSQGRSRHIKMSDLPKTVLSTVDGTFPTALCAKKEIESWTFYQLEPHLLRRQSTLTSADRLSDKGENLPATMYSLAQRVVTWSNDDPKPDPDRFFAAIANRLSDLISGVKHLEVEKNEAKDTYTLFLTDKNGTRLPAEFLSDGTLRFLALATISLDPRVSGLVLLEEPENGISPNRMGAMQNLLEQLATDPAFEIDPLDNPLRQVIVNSHSVPFMRLVDNSNLLITRKQRIPIAEGEGSQTVFLPVAREQESHWRLRKSETGQRVLGRDLESFLSVEDETLQTFSAAPPTQSSFFENDDSV